VSDLERESNSLHDANAVLERLVSERTADLSQTILQLRQQLAEMARARKAGRE
jgi:C4-dicarboxylate-specific signal transduction histidine kinase